MKTALTKRSVYCDYDIMIDPERVFKAFEHIPYRAYRITREERRRDEEIFRDELCRINEFSTLHDIDWRASLDNCGCDMEMQTGDERIFMK